MTKDQSFTEPDTLELDIPYLAVDDIDLAIQQVEYDTHENKNAVVNVVFLQNQPDGSKRVVTAIRMSMRQLELSIRKINRKAEDFLNT